MGYARYVGRIGALAVALGVGYAVATMPGIALALPTDSGSSSSSTSDAAGAQSSDNAGDSGPSSPTANPGTTSGQSQTTGTTGVTAGQDSSDEIADGQDADDGDDDSQLADANGENGSPATGDEDASAAVVADSANGADHHNSNKPERSLGSLDSAKQDVDEHDSSVDATQLGSHQQVQAFSIDTTPDVSSVARSSLAPTGVVTTLTTPSAAVSPAEPPTIQDIVGQPAVFVVNLVARVVDAVLQPLMAPFGPGSNGQAPLLWTMLAFVRDEFRRIAFPTMSTNPVTPSLVTGPNLLVNPGAELGDPSLSGYSGVSVPGWALTGTPTVIEYGTLRRFPFPLPTPGPTLPGLLAFPSQGPAGSGQQFFGGGPVADSTLTQIVDLKGAADAIDNRPGGVQYQLSGDLGGFLIDPSRAKVTVDFLDGQGATLGSGELTPVTALDRWFITGLMHRDTAGVIPVGARTAQVVVSFKDCNPVLGNYNNAYADNLSFTVDAEGLAPATLERPESTVGSLDHVFMVYLENKGVRQIVGSPNAPYINGLIDQYGYASDYYGLTHPSDPNYYPIIGGSDFGFNYNCPSKCFPAGTPTLVKNIDAAQLSWAGYAEGGGGYTTPTDRLPFLAFSDIYDDPQYVATHLFDISELGAGLADPAKAPNFVWFAADDATNMEGPTDIPFGIFNWALGFLSPFHQYNVAAGDEWLQGPVGTIMSSPTWLDSSQKSAIVITFDEDYNNLSTGVGNEGNHIVTIVIPSQGAVDAGMRDGHVVADDHYNHYSLLRTIEDSLGLSPVTNNDRYANPMNEFWELPAV